MRWKIDGGFGDQHIVAIIDKEWWGTENVRPRDQRADFLRAVLSGATSWRHYSIRPLDNTNPKA